MLYRSLTLGLTAMLLLCAGCAGLHGASDEEQVADLIETWRVAFGTADADATLALYSEYFTSQFADNKAAMREFLEGDQAQDILSQMEIETDEALITIEEDTATVEPIYMGDFSLRLTLAKESDGWKIIGTGQSE